MTDIKQEKTINSKVLKQIKDKIDRLMDNGSSLDHAISVVCRVNGFNPKTVKEHLDKVYNIEEKTEKADYKDIKNDEGSYVMLKKNPGKEYEVININNKDNIVISDLDNDTELKVKEEEIIPIVTETKMNEKLNEAQYTVSIDNLETTDAETLSQMLSLAGQAEQPVAEEMPMDPVAEPAPVMDYEPTIPSTIDGPGFEAAEIDSMPTGDFPSVEEEPTVDDMGYGVTVDDDMPVVDAEEDVVLPAQEDEIMGESVEGEEGLSEDVLVPSSEKAEKENPLTDSENESMYEKCARIFNDIVADVGEDEKAIGDRIASLHDMGKISDEQFDCLQTRFNEFFNDMDELKRDVEWEKRMDAKDIKGEMRTDDDMEECGQQPVKEEEDFDDEIAETLRLAGVQLNEDTYGEITSKEADEGKEDLPMFPIDDANPAAPSKDEEAKAQEPDYKETPTEKVMGYDATLGFETPANVGFSLKVSETVNKDKIAAILETAKHMYAKKDSSEWLALDRRYVEKLLKEGVGYTNASKMLLKAKAGK